MGHFSKGFLWLLATVSMMALLVGLFDTKTRVGEHQGIVDRVECGPRRGTPIANECSVVVRVDNGSTFQIYAALPNTYVKGQRIKVYRYQHKYTRRNVWQAH